MDGVGGLGGFGGCILEALKNARREGCVDVMAVLGLECVGIDDSRVRVC